MPFLPMVTIFFVALVTALFTTPVAGRIAARLGAVDVPNELSIHTRPTPRAGGLAILAGFLVAVGYAGWRGVLDPGRSPLLWGILIGGALVALAGLFDDVKRISPMQKFLWQFLAASVVIGLGLQVRTLPVVGLGLTLTLFYLVGSANGMNLIDGMDGLAAGVSILAALGLGLMGLVEHNGMVAGLAFALAGGVAGFLPFNFPRARTFMGDVGSLFLGFTLACLGGLLADRPYDLLGFVAPVLVLGVPALDTALALARRFRRRGDLFSGDRDHTYDVLARRWGKRRAVVALWGVTALLGWLAVAATWAGGWVGGGLVLLAVGLMPVLVQVSGVLAPLQGARRARGDVRRALVRFCRRYVHPLVLDVMVVAASFFLALGLRFSGEWAGDGVGFTHYAGLMGRHIFFVASAYAIGASLFGLYNRMWSWVSRREVLSVLGAGGSSTLAILIVDLLWGAGRPIPLSVVVMGGMLATAGILTLRYYRWLVGGRRHRPATGREVEVHRTIIVGAGEAGHLLAWQMQHNGGHYRPVGFVDDDLEKVGLQIHGIPVLGGVSQVPEIVTRQQANLVVIAKNGMNRERLREVFSTCQASNARIQVVPDALTHLARPNGRVPVRDVTVEDLLGRPPREVDHDACRALVAGKVVLVTGAAGSIGSELCRQVVGYGPARLLTVDQNETGLYDLALELKGIAGDVAVDLLVGDVGDWRRMESIWRRHRPAVVFHCAAYKHVPILEDCPDEAAKTNVQGTLVPATLSQRWGTERFIFVSTDKAACPINVLGASKRVGELLVMALQDIDVRGTRFSAVRFGNVLGSRGSVMPTFARQIAQGGPVTVTHPEMERFFMSIQEAVSLVIQAGAFTRGGDLFILDMGEPARIDDLARKMIRLRGLRVGEDIEVIYTGIRPGEKLTEVLYCPVGEALERTDHDSILRVANGGGLPTERILAAIERVNDLTRRDGDGFPGLEEAMFEAARLLCPQQCVHVVDEGRGGGRSVDREEGPTVLDVGSRAALQTPM